MSFPGKAKIRSQSRGDRAAQMRRYRAKRQATLAGIPPTENEGIPPTQEDEGITSPYPALPVGGITLSRFGFFVALMDDGWAITDDDRKSGHKRFATAKEAIDVGRMALNQQLSEFWRLV